MPTQKCLISVINVKALVGAFNQEKALVGAFSVIVKTGCGTDGSFYSTNLLSCSISHHFLTDDCLGESSLHCNFLFYDNC